MSNIDNSTYSTATNWYTTSSGPSHQYYSIDQDGQMIPIDSVPEHNHITPNIPEHNHNGWRVDMAPAMGTSMGDYYNGQIVQTLLKRLDRMEAILENLYNTSPQWQKDRMNDNKQVEKEQTEHFDPDLFKV